jgi:cell division protein FtsQ
MRRQPRRWVKPALRASMVVASLASIAGSAWWLNRAGKIAEWTQAARTAVFSGTAMAGLTLSEVTVEGRSRQPVEPILRALGLKRGDPVLGLDLDLARARLEALPWVREATIERRLPGLIHVRLSEREPIALWQRGGRFVLVDREGVEIMPDSTGSFVHLPVIVGQDAPLHAAALLAALAVEPDLASRVKAAVWVGGRRWNLRLDDVKSGIDVRLPETQASAAWRRLARLEREHGLLERKVEMIDLRLPDRLVVGAPQAPQTVLPAKPGAKPKKADGKTGKEA